MEILPLQDYVVIQEAESILEASSIYIPDSADMEPKNQGKVIKVNENTTEFKEGDLVIFKRFMFDNLGELLGDKTYRGLVLGRKENVIALIKPTKQ